MPVLPPDAPANAVGYEPHAKEYWVRCEQGHTHYGAHGAAGLLMRHTDDQGTETYYLQRRAAWVDHGGTWSIPGGALRPGETPEEGALREAMEEIGQLPPLRPARIYRDGHGGWSYHTVIVDVMFWASFEGSNEHAGGGWFTPQQMGTLRLHPGFAATWPAVLASR